MPEAEDDHFCDACGQPGIRRYGHLHAGTPRNLCRICARREVGYEVPEDVWARRVAFALGLVTGIALGGAAAVIGLISGKLPWPG